MTTADTALYIPPYKADDQDVVVELNQRFGPEAFLAQETRTGMPVRVAWAVNASAPKRLFSSTTTSWSSAL